MFQRTIENTLKGLAGTICFQDDVLVHGGTKSQCEKLWRAVQDRLKDKGFTINEMKSGNVTEKITFLGFTVSGSGIEPDDCLVNKVSKIQPPQSVKEVEQFCGLVDFYGRFISNFTSKIAPISDLRNNSEAEFQWTDKCQRAFERLKSELASKPVVQPNSLKKEETITTDASEKAIGGVLSLWLGHPVTYESKTMSQAEQRYSDIEREPLAIVFVVKRLKQFLLGRKFHLETDHLTLEFIVAPNKELPKTVSARIARWAISLMGFDYEIEYKEGSSIPLADAMSRLNFNRDDNERNLVDYVSSILDEFCVRFAEYKLIPFEELRSECERDELAKRIIRRVIDGDWEACTQVESFFKKVSGFLTVENGLLYIGTRPYITPRMRNIVIERDHDTHPGVQAT